MFKIQSLTQDFRCKMGKRENSRLLQLLRSISGSVPKWFAALQKISVDLYGIYTAGGGVLFCRFSIQLSPRRGSPGAIASLGLVLVGEDSSGNQEATY